MIQISETASEPRPRFGTRDVKVEVGPSVPGPRGPKYCILVFGICDGRAVGCYQCQVMQEVDPIYRQLLDYFAVRVGPTKLLRYHIR